jgi:osmotically-inducible protein OsmY
LKNKPELLVDEDLRAAVLLALANDADLAPLDLRVGVLNAIVHLCGSAPTLALWERASRVAGDVPGVRAVVNRICAPGALQPTRTIHLDIKSVEPLVRTDSL